MCEEHTLFCNPVKDTRIDTGIPIDSCVGITPVIRKQKHDVRPVIFGESSRKRSETGNCQRTYSPEINFIQECCHIIKDLR